MALLTPYYALCRVSLSLSVACSTATGFFVAHSYRSTGVFVPTIAVFFLACGASALNQYQERAIDGKMERTRSRPIPRGIVAPGAAATFAFMLIIAGLSLLLKGGGMKTAGLGILALFWYNGVYTALKKVTPFASLPGAVIGMIPPAIGWMYAGGKLMDARLAAICFVFFLWQVPHFWLLLLRHGEDYERAGLPSLTRIMSNAQISRITFAWIVAASTASLVLPLYGTVTSPLVCLTLAPLSVWLIWSERALAVKMSLLPLTPRQFRSINTYLFLIMSLVTLDGLFIR